MDERAGLNISRVIVFDLFLVLGLRYGTVHQNPRQIVKVFESEPLQMDRSSL